MANDPAVNRYDHLLEGTDCAWKLWLDLRPGMRVLDIGCGYGGRSLSLARHGLSIIAVDTDPDRVVFTKQRLDALAGKQTLDHHVACVSRLDRLPLADRCVDLILLPTDIAGTEMMSEAARLLSADGQILLLAANRWGLDRQLGRTRLPSSGTTSPIHGLRGYQRILNRSGIESISSLVIKRNSRGNLVGIHEYSRFRSRIGKPGLRGRLRELDLLAPEFAVIGRRAGDQGFRPLITRVLDAVVKSPDGRQHPPIHPVKYHLSRKDKLVVEARQDGLPLILRCALSPAARTAEQRNAAMLDRLGQAHARGGWFPRLLACGELGGVYYIAEQQLSGQPLSRHHAGITSSQVLDIAADLLERINPELENTAAMPLTGALYDELITQPLDAVIAATGRSDAAALLREFFREQLFGQPMVTGITHGDFSLSNILMQDTGSSALIDWEDCQESGIPLLDAFTFLNSCRLRTAHRGKPKKGKRVSYLATERLTPAESEFLDRQYRRCRIPREAHLALVCLRWLNMAARLANFSFMMRPDAARLYLHDGLEGYLDMIQKPGSISGQTP